MVDRSDTPWYPEHMRLFRQSPGGAWPAVVAAVAEALDAWVKERGAAYLASNRHL